MKKRLMFLVIVVMFGLFLASCADEAVEFTISFDTNGGSDIADIVIEDGAAISLPEAPTRDGYTFVGWYVDEALANAFTTGTIPTGDITLYAKWEAVVSNYTVTFETDGGSFIANATVAAGGMVTEPVDPTKSGFEFAGWYTDQALTTAYDFATAVNANLVLYAKWAVPLTSITFSGIADGEVAYGSVFDVFEGVTAIGNNGVDYTDVMTVTSLTVADGLLDTTKVQEHGLRYEVRIGEDFLQQQWRYITVLPPERPDTFVVNGTFDEGTAFWDDAANGLYIADGAALTITHDATEGSGSLKAEVVAGTNLYTPRFGQQGIAFEQGKTYEVSFKAKSTVEKEINVQVGELISYAPWFIDFKTGQTEHHIITTEWQTFSFKFTMNLDNPRGGILFELGKLGTQIDATMWFDDISAVETEAGPIEGFHFLDGWTENDPDTYDFSTVEEALVVDYTKGAGQEWAFMRRNFTTEEAGTYNTLIMTLDGEAGKSVLVKPNDNGLLEETVTFGAEPVTIKIHADAFTSVLIFAEPNTASVTGQFTISLAVLTTETIQPEDPEWNGFNMTVTQTETNVTIEYADTPVEWWNHNAQLQVVDFDGTKEQISFTFTGVVDHEYLFKIEGGGIAKETPIVGDGNEQTVILDLSEFTVEQRNGLILIVVFVKTETASGTVVVNNWEYVVTEPEWIGYGLTVLETENDVTITYADTPNNWWENNAQLSVVNFNGNREKVMFMFTGVAGQEYLFKIEGGGIAKEASMVADGNEQTIILDLSEFTVEQRNGLALIVVFSKTPGASGTLVVKNWEYVIEWIGYGLTVVNTENDVTITYADTPNNWWENNAQLTVVNFDGTNEGIVFTFTGVAGQDYLFKIEGGGAAVEATVTADGNAQELILDLSGLTQEQRDGLNLIVVFSKTPGASGTLVVNNWEYPTVA